MTGLSRDAVPGPCRGGKPPRTPHPADEACIGKRRSFPQILGKRVPSLPGRPAKPAGHCAKGTMRKAGGQPENKCICFRVCPPAFLLPGSCLATTQVSGARKSVRCFPSDRRGEVQGMKSPGSGRGGEEPPRRRGGLEKRRAPTASHTNSLPHAKARQAVFIVRITPGYVPWRGSRR